MSRNRLTAIDLNRAGMALMEIVSEPDMRYVNVDRLSASEGVLLTCAPHYRSPEEAGHYVRALQALLRSVGSSDGNMEQVCHKWLPCTALELNLVAAGIPSL